MRCPHCKRKLIQKSGSNTRVRITGQVLFKSDGKCHTQCFWCKEPVEVPLEIQDGTSIESVAFILPEKSAERGPETDADKA